MMLRNLCCTKNSSVMIESCREYLLDNKRNFVVGYGDIDNDGFMLVLVFLFLCWSLLFIFAELIRCGRMLVMDE